MLFKKKKNFVGSPCIGEFMKLEDVKDEVFSKGLVGQGFAVIPKESLVCSPVEGEITMIFPTLHAIGIKDALGMEYIIHIGIDTVGLKGEGFSSKCELNQKVKVGDPLIEVDFDFIRKKGLVEDVIVVVTNAKDISFKNKSLQLNIGDEVFVCE